MPQSLAEIRADLPNNDKIFKVLTTLMGRQKPGPWLSGNGIQFQGPHANTPNGRKIHALGLKHPGNAYFLLWARMITFKAAGDEAMASIIFALLAGNRNLHGDWELIKRSAGNRWKMTRAEAKCVSLMGGGSLEAARQDVRDAALVIEEVDMSHAALLRRALDGADREDVKKRYDLADTKKW